MGKIKRGLLTLLALLGLITSIKLIVIFYESNYNPYALNSFCSVNTFIDCDGVAKTTHAVFCGIPLCIWGVILYLFVLFLIYVDKLKTIKYLGFLKAFKNPLSYLFGLGFFSFLISMSLACISIFELKKLCILCVFTYILNLIIALTAVVGYKRMPEAIKDCFVDFYEALKIKSNLIAFLALAILTAGALIYLDKSCAFAPHIKRLRSFDEFKKMKGNPYKVSGNQLGDRNAKVVVAEYTDYMCPFCEVLNIMVHRAVKELEGVRVVHYNFPLDKNCNKAMQIQMHEGACIMAKYALAAGKQGKFWDMNNILFEKKPNTEEKILEEAKDLGLDLGKLKSDANSKEIDDELQEEITLGLKNNIIATPTVQINMKIIPGIMPYYELKEKLIEAGAK